MNAMAPQGPFVLDGLLWHDDDRVLSWMVERNEVLQGRGFGAARAIGILQGGHLVGGVAYSIYVPHPEGGDCFVSMVLALGARVTRRMWRHFYWYGFAQLGCRRLSTQFLKRDRPGRRLAERMGWKLEVTAPEALGTKTLVHYGLLRSQLRNGLPLMKKG